MKINELVEVARRYNEKEKSQNNLTYVKRLKLKLTQKSNLNNQECLELSEEINNFMNSDAPEKDKALIRGYAESLLMICNAIKEGKL